jgi:hypothetical protein
MASQPLPLPDFRKFLFDGIDVLDSGLPELPKELSYSVPVPLAYWKTEACATVLYLYYWRDGTDVTHHQGFSGY